MSQNEVTKAVLNILEKELKNLNKLIPGDFLKTLERTIAPDLNNVIEKSGFVSKVKYDSLSKIANDLEKRISDLEKD